MHTQDIESLFSGHEILGRFHNIGGMREVERKPDNVLPLLNLRICFLDLRDGSRGPLFRARSEVDLRAVDRQMLNDLEANPCTENRQSRYDTAYNGWFNSLSSRY